MTVLKTNYTSFPFIGPFVLMLLWVLVQMIVWLHYGVVEAADSEFYIHNAQALLKGTFPEGREIWYCSYSILLALVFWAGGNLSTVVILQIVFSGIAAFALYKTVAHFFQDIKTAFFAVLFYLAWIKVHQWNSYIYTESLFISCSILSFALLSMGKRTSQYILTGLLLAFTLFLRPAGVCLFTALCGFLIYKARQKNTFSTTALITTLSLTFIAVLVLLNGMLDEYVYYFIDSYSKAELIYPNVSLGFHAPEQLAIPSAEHEPLFQLIEFIAYNPVYFVKLSFLKLLLFIGNVKPYFSWVHNLLIVCMLYPLYGLAVYGYRKMAWSAEKLFILFFILSQTFTVSMTSENWDGRFLLVILPFVFILSAVGARMLLKKWQHVQSR